MTELAALSATELTRRLRDRALGSAELLDYYRQRYEALNVGINAIVSTDVDAAAERARQADAALARGENWGPLHGLPITLKDNIETTDLPTTYGVPEYRDCPKSDDVTGKVPATPTPNTALSRVRFERLASIFLFPFRNKQEWNRSECNNSKTLAWVSNY